MLLNYFVSELRQSASQNLSKKDGAVKTATFFSERFCEADWRKFRNKEAAREPPWLTDGIDGRSLCTLIFSVDLTYMLQSSHLQKYDSHAALVPLKPIRIFPPS